MLINLPAFISKHVTGREESLFKSDLERFQGELASGINGRSMLVIGGAGTIGAAFIKTALKYHLARLFVVDINENGLTELVRDLRSSNGYHIPKDFLTYPVDFSDPVFERILREQGPFEIVANFAAHKHVRSEKDLYSIEAMITNNVFKARRLLELLVEHKPERFFCVSTDKAANPVNVMGASKKLMEQLLQAYAAVLPVTTARFANVAFSNGSLPAGFLERLMKRQPISAPVDVARFFQSPEEAGQLCLLACMLGKPGEIFFPKLDRETDIRRFSEIAVALLQTFGFQANICENEETARRKANLLTANSISWPVYFFDSDTSGEKAVEEFYTANEVLEMDRFSSIGIIRSGQSDGRNLGAINTICTELQTLFQTAGVSKSMLINVLERHISDFNHQETGKGLDQRM